jgi:asparagine synthase (glutamine-hydrolysing)
MCGISLIFTKTGQHPDQNRVKLMNGALRHRGPNDEGVVIRGRAALGHTRLSIVDLHNGAQPILTSDGRFAIVYNGELYNFRQLRTRLEQAGVEFQTHSDTEVILHLFAREGENCLHQLRGMFCFIIHDAKTDTVFIARDRLGIKPLYYWWDGEVFIAASEMKALFASDLVDARFNLHSLRNYFIYQFAISPNTPFENVFELPPGHQLCLKPNSVPQISCYWDLEFPRDGEYESFAEDFWTTQFREALEDAVDCHMIGDVPIGAYLSGGIDSSAITWLLNKHYTQPLQTFSIQLAGSDLDESGTYKNTATHLKLENKELIMGEDRPEGFLSDFEQCIYHLEQPQRLAVDIPHFLLSDIVHASRYKVVYTGDGADELMGGYDCYRHDYMRSRGNQFKTFWRRRKHYLAEYSNHFAEDYVRLMLRLHKPKNQRRVMEQFGCYPAWYDFWHITEDLLPGLFCDEFAAANQSEQQMEQLAAQMKPSLEGRHGLNQSLYIETKTRLPGWILWKSDRLSMAHSVEARVPFMDHHLVELAVRMPPSMKLRDMDEKYVLKKIVLPHLPQNPTRYKKRGFYTPIREWFFTEAQRPQLEPYFSKQALEKTAVFNSERVIELYEQLLAQSKPADMNEYYRVMRLEWILMTVLSIQILHKLFIEKSAPCFQSTLV